MSRLSAYRWQEHDSVLGLAIAVAFVCTLTSGVLPVGPAAAGTSLSVKVTPDRGLVNGQVVTISGRGLNRPAGTTGLTWFVTECTAVVRQRMNPATDTPHCDVADARAVKVGHDGTFLVKFDVRAGIVGDGYCGTGGHATCVIAISTAKGQGSVVKIGFGIPKSTTTTTPPSTTVP